MSWDYNTKAVGVTFDNRQANVQTLQAGFKVFWKHEPENPYDKNAIALFADPSMCISIGHLSKEVAAKFVARMKDSIFQEIFVEQVTGGTGNKSSGVNLKIIVHSEKRDAPNEE